MVNKIIQAYEAKDLALLQKLVRPQSRVQNSSQSYRSVLMLSAHNIKHLLKIPELEAECIMLNLEDGVSKEEKPFALLLCAFFLSYYKECKKKLIVRVNPLDEGGAKEIEFLNQFCPDGIRIPKVRTLKDIQQALALVDATIELHLSIETKEAWLNLRTFAHPRIKAFYLGILDLYADLGLSQEQITPTNPATLHILSEFLVTTKALGVKPVSFVYQAYQDLEGFRAFLEVEKAIGFDAKGCVAPKQVSVVHEVFGYSKEEIAKAKEIIKLFEEKQKEGVSGFSHPKYGFIDEPIYKGALAIVQNS